MAGNETRAARYYAYSPSNGKVRMPQLVSEFGTDQAQIEAVRDLEWVTSLTREEGPTNNPTKITIIWERNPKSRVFANLEDVDATLAALIVAEEAMRPFHGAEAIAVRAILALSKAGDKLADLRRTDATLEYRIQARALMAELARER